MTEQKLGPNPTPYMGHAAFHPYIAKPSASMAIFEDQSGGQIRAMPPDPHDTIASLTRMLEAAQKALEAEREQGNRLASSLMEAQAKWMEQRDLVQAMRDKIVGDR